jgi:hypothetical protein
MKKEGKRIHLHRETVRLLDQETRAGQVAQLGQIGRLGLDTADTCDVGSCAAERCCSGEGTTCMT